jgi:hypothetical protein
MTQQLRERMDKWDYVKLRSFCTVKETVTRMKRQFTGRKSLLAIHQKLNSQGINGLMKKWAKEVNRAFTKEEVQMAKNHMKKYSPSLTIKEMQIKLH